MRPLIAAAVATLALAGCDEGPAPTAASDPELVDLSELPTAYRTPQAIMQAMTTGQLFERPPRCEGFAVTASGLAAGLDDWTRMAVLARDFAGRDRAAVITRTVDVDEAAGTVIVRSTPLGEAAEPFETVWSLDAADDRIACVRRVEFRRPA